MGTKLKVGLISGLAIGVMLIVVDQYLTVAEVKLAKYFLPILLVIFCLMSFIQGRKLNRSLKFTSLIVFFYWSVNWTLLGRVETVHLSFANFATGSIFFLISSFLLYIPIYRLFEGKTRISVFAAYPVAAIATALSIASIEERVFVDIYSEGSGPKPRWTVNIAWLAYDESADKLSGGW